MNLREYLFRQEMSVVEFSRKIECTRDHLSRIIHGHKKPSKRLAKDIEVITNGEVKADELLKEKI